MPLQRAHCPFSSFPSPYLSDFSLSVISFPVYFSIFSFLDTVHIHSSGEHRPFRLQTWRLTLAQSVVQMFLPIMTPSLCLLQVETTCNWHCLAMTGTQGWRERRKLQYVTDTFTRLNNSLRLLLCTSTSSPVPEKCRSATVVIECKHMLCYCYSSL